MRIARSSLFTVAAFFAVACAARVHRADDAKPRHLLLIVVDQMRPEYVERMPNVKKLRDRGASLDDAIVGHMSSKTVVSHAVVTRGVFPKRLGWADDQMRDAGAVLGSNANAMWVTGAFSLDDMRKLLPRDVVTIASAFPGRSLSIGAKGYAANAMIGHEADVVLTMQRSKERKGWYEPAGVNVPAYLRVDRFFVDATATHGTEGAPYALGGNRFVPGDDPEHLGGDLWVADAVADFMKREQWSVALVALAGVDKVGHMMGAERDLEKPNASKVTMKLALESADAAIGKLIASAGEEALVILTSDHGGMFAENHRARWRAGELDYDLSYGSFANAPPTLRPQPDIAALVAIGGVQATSTDMAVRVWTEAGTPKTDALIAHMTKMPGVIAVYRLRADRYDPAYEDFSKLPADEREFHEKHARALMQTMASPTAADLVALLDQKTGYGMLGDHGGAQSAVQKIPLILAGPGVKPGRYAGDARLVDVAPTVWQLVGEKPSHAMDGSPLCSALAAGCR